jgi:acetyl coenzyme A synthetase (ADP forming)-like protein
LGKLNSLFNPASVAVIGASANPQKVGYAVVRNLKQVEYQGAVYPINLRETEILGFKCYKTIGEVGPVDHAVICIPTQGVLGAAEECGQAGVKHLVVITAGFKEVGGEGVELEKKLRAVCDKYNMTLTGPNCLGVLSTHDKMNASFGSTHPHTGGIGFISQSGALGAAVLDWSAGAGVGLSRFASMGNRAGLTEADFLEDMGEDPNTKVIIAYLESIADGPRFMDTLRKVSMQKPVLILKSGVGAAGQRAASSHTGSLAGNDMAYEMAVRQSGGIRVHGAQEFVDLATAFSLQPVPAGNRWAIITNAGGPGILCTDAIERVGNLAMAGLTPETLEVLKAALPPVAGLNNPVDVVGDAGADRYIAALEPVLHDPNVDGVIVIVTPQAMTEPVPTVKAIAEILQKLGDKPVLTCFMGGERVTEAARISLTSDIPPYDGPERVAIAASGMSKYAAIRAKGQGTPIPRNAASRQAVADIFAKVRKDGRHALLGCEAAQVIEAYGISAAPSRLANSAAEAAKNAEEIGYPIALKIASPDILHKSDVGGVKLGLKSAEAVAAEFDVMMEKCSKVEGAKIYGVEVQRMMPPGREIIIGMVRDAVFGPMVMFGMGGIYVNLMKDVSFRLTHNLTVEDVAEMVRETKAYTLLAGYRGEAPADVKAVEDAIAKVAALVSDFSEIDEFDINPLFVYSEGLSALDVKITLA